MKTVALVALAVAGVAQAAPPPDGHALYAGNCAACHQASGQGVPGAFPALAGDRFVVGDPDGIVTILLDGRGAMPSFRDTLDDAQLAAVASYARSSWGNAGAPLAPSLFTAARRHPAPAR